MTRAPAIPSRRRPSSSSGAPPTALAPARRWPGRRRGGAVGGLRPGRQPAGDRSVRPSASPSASAGRPATSRSSPGPRSAFANPTDDAAVGQTIPTVDGEPRWSAASPSARASRRSSCSWPTGARTARPRCRSSRPGSTPAACPTDVELDLGLDRDRPGRAELPARAWLAREGWTAPVIDDPTAPWRPRSACRRSRTSCSSTPTARSGRLTGEVPVADLRPSWPACRAADAPRSIRGAMVRTSDVTATRPPPPNPSGTTRARRASSPCPSASGSSSRADHRGHDPRLPGARDEPSAALLPPAGGRPDGPPDRRSRPLRVRVEGQRRPTTPWSSASGASRTSPGRTSGRWPGFEAIAGYLAFYPGRVDEAWVGDERARPGRWVLRGLDHAPGHGAVQGRARHPRLVARRRVSRSPVGHAHDVEAAVDVEDLAGHGARQVRGEVHGAPADVLDRDVGAQRGDLVERRRTVA